MEISDARMTTAEREKYVRERWEHVNWGASNYELTQFGVILYDDEDGTAFRKNSQASAWQAAYDFTLAREEEIRQVEEEIKWLGDHAEISESQQKLYRERGLVFSAEFLRQLDVAKRILTREQAALTDLKRGMK